MIVRSLSIRHFGKFTDREITLRHGFNVVTGGNDSGKTTIAAFIRSMLYGLKPGSDLYQRYLPEDGGDTFGGVLRAEIDGETYEIERDFLADSLTVTAVSDGLPVEDPAVWLTAACGGVSEEDYAASSFFAQDALRSDIVSWKGDAASAAAETRAAAARKSFADAKEHLIEQRREKEEKLSEIDSDQDSSEIDGKLNEIVSKISEYKEKLIPGITKDIEEQEALYQNELDAVQAEKRKAVAEAKQEMIAKKESLSEFDYTKEADFAAGKNVGGTVLMITGILAAVVGAFLNSSYRPEAGSTMRTTVLVCWIFGVFCVVAGIVLTIIIISQKKDSIRQMMSHAELRKEAEAQEETYDRMLSSEQTEEPEIPGGEELEYRIASMRKMKQLYESELSTLEQHQTRLFTEKTRIDGVMSDVRKVTKDLEALDAAIAAFTTLSAHEEDDTEKLAAAANRYLEKLGMKEGQYVTIAPGGSAVLLSGERKLPLSTLSTGAARTVCLALRLALIEKYDPEHRLPVIADDIFAGFDEERMNAGMRTLHLLKGQVILLSCQTREQKAL